ncbi:MAG: calcium-binding protein [Coleofasciculus sp. A1-SPW-01]|uniref:calcium-binding protein n=1 Tax=Coleofasciculus sp. A1-SPW-01 TaxID=3070819 RepID=UPI0032F48F45
MLFYLGTPGSDSFAETPTAPNQYRSTELNDTLLGQDGDDILIGLGGDDLLIGGPGQDRIEGGTGNDIYYVDAADDPAQIVEVDNAFGGGYDSVFSSANWTLGQYFEKLELTGTRNINGTGNELNNLMYGNSGANTLNGLGGNDSLYGRAGNDKLFGSSGNDILDGGLGADRMEGGTGDDQYFVENLADVVVEQVDQGIDRVYVFVNNYKLTPNVEHLFLAGGIPTLIYGTGNSLSNYIKGNENNNVIDGGSGNDFIEGNTGNDLIVGGSGDDRLNGDTGNDRLLGDSGNDTLNGGTGGDALIGSTGNDLLNGGEGNDYLQGDAGQDILVGDAGVNAGLDIMIGGGDADIFMLGSGTTSFYLGGANYTQIIDFNFGEGDRIDQDEAPISVRTFGTSNSYIYAGSTGSGDLIAIVSGAVLGNDAFIGQGAVTII